MGSPKRETLPQKVARSFMQADNFGQSRTFTINGSDKYHSVPGACITILMKLLIFLFCIQRLIMLWNRDFFIFYDIPTKRGLDRSRAFSKEEIGFY